MIVSVCDGMNVGHPEGMVPAANMPKMVFVYQERLVTMCWRLSMYITCGVLPHALVVAIYVDATSASQMGTFI